MSESKQRLKTLKAELNADDDDKDTIAKIKKQVKKEQDTETPPKASKKEAHTDTTKTKKVKKEEISSQTPEDDSIKKKKDSKEALDKKKKVFTLPGQKHDPPDERDPLRMFYESLYQQNPKSEMAEFWMMEHGLLELDIAKKAFERKKKNQGNQKLGTPVKQTKESTGKTIKSDKNNSTSKSEKKTGSVNGNEKSSKAKRARDPELDSDDDFLVKPKKSKSSS